MEHPGEVGLRGASLARNLQGSSLQKAAIAAGEGADLDAVVEDASNKDPFPPSWRRVKFALVWPFPKPTDVPSRHRIITSGLIHPAASRTSLGPCSAERSSVRAVTGKSTTDRRPAATSAA
jgi:hypothetical protein